MPHPPESKSLRGTKPEWLNLPRRKCDNCGKSYKPTRPNSRFCPKTAEKNCTAQFHRHGGAYMKLKEEMTKMAAAQYAMLEKRLREIVREEIAATVVTDSLLEFRGRD